jgi:hypothetical protein
VRVLKIAAVDGVAAGYEFSVESGAENASDTGNKDFQHPPPQTVG